MAQIPVNRIRNDGLRIWLCAVPEVRSLKCCHPERNLADFRPNAVEGPAFRDARTLLRILGNASLERTAGGDGRGPGPLEIESAQVSGYIDCLADKEQAGHVTRLHGAGMKIARVDAAG